MSDAPRHDAPQPDDLRHTLTVREVEVLLASAGVQRSHRHVLRLCQSGMLDAVKIPGGPSGEEWYVAPVSVPKAIGDLKQIDAQRARRAVAQPAMSVHVADGLAPNLDPITASHVVPQPATAAKQPSENGSETEPAMARYVGQLEKRIEEKDDVIGLLKGQLTAKDEQIGELSTRYRETHSLLGAMQRMFAPLLGQADPYTAADRREVREPVDNSATGNTSAGL